MNVSYLAGVTTRHIVSLFSGPLREVTSPWNLCNDSETREDSYLDPNLVSYNLRGRARLDYKTVRFVLTRQTERFRNSTVSKTLSASRRG